MYRDKAHGLPHGLTWRMFHSALEKNVFSCCLVEFSTHVCDDLVVLSKFSTSLLIFSAYLFYLLLKLRILSSPIIIFESSVSLFLTVFASVFWSFVVRCIFLYNCYIFLMD
jgi:hypothetical protein